MQDLCQTCWRREGKNSQLLNMPEYLSRLSFPWQPNLGCLLCQVSSFLIAISLMWATSNNSFLERRALSLPLTDTYWSPCAGLTVHMSACIQETPTRSGAHMSEMHAPRNNLIKATAHSSACTQEHPHAKASVLGSGKVVYISLDRQSSDLINDL